MKKNKNALLSFGSYILAFVWYFIWVSFASSPSTLAASIAVYGYFILIFIGIIFSFISVGVIFSFVSHEKKESPWIGSLLMLMGILNIIISFFILHLYSITP